MELTSIKLREEFEKALNSEKRLIVVVHMYSQDSLVKRIKKDAEVVWFADLEKRKKIKNEILEKVLSRP